MRSTLTSCACVIVTIALCLMTSQAADYVNEWAVHVEGGEEHARDTAQQLGFIYGGKVSDVTL